MAKKQKEKKRLTEQLRGKLVITYVVIICLFLLLTGQLIFWYAVHGKEYSTTVLGQQTNSSLEIPYERGKIYDRNGNILAGNEKLYTLILEPKNIYSVSNPEKQKACMDATVQVVQTYFQVDEAEVRQKIEQHKNSYYVPVKTGLTFKQVEAYNKFMEEFRRTATKNDTDHVKARIRQANNVRGVTFESYYKRIYPYESLACHLIGFTSSGNVGNWGIEQYYNSTLNGTNGRTYSYFNQDLTEEATIKEAVDGNSVVSTIDLQIQQVIEQKLKEFDRTIGSQETSILVMDPNNGEVLGMANSDPFDLNEPTNESYLHYKYTDGEIDQIYAYTEEVLEKEARGETVKKKKNDKRMTKWEALSKVWRNPIISDTHEPGSTYKPFTVCAGLESGVLTGNEDYVCTGSLHVSNRNIGCSHVHGNISLKQAVSESCNVAMMNIAFKEGADRFYYYQNLFGFGEKTGVDLPGEADTAGLVYHASNYGNSTSLATNAFGQNFNCTMIEMATGFASLINGGYYYQPHVVKEIENKNGDIVGTKEKEVLRRTVSESTSKKIRSYLKETVKSGTGTRAQIDGYSIGGKTGTAEKIPRNKKDYYISFMGFTPVDRPRVLIYVTIDEPHIDKQDNARLAVGLERECMKEIVDILGIEPTEKESGNSGSKESYLNEFLKKETKTTQSKKTTKAAEATKSTKAAKDKKTTKATEAAKKTKAAKDKKTTKATEATKKTKAAKDTKKKKTTESTKKTKKGNTEKSTKKTKKTKQKKQN